MSDKTQVERMLEIQAQYERDEASDSDGRAECPQGIHGWRQVTPNGLCPWCEWEEVEARVLALAHKWEARATPGEWSRALHPRQAAEDLRAAVLAKR